MAIDEQLEANIKPIELPFLKAVCWDLRNVDLLSHDEMLNRYERGWPYRDVLAEISHQEMQYIAGLARAKGSWLILTNLR